MLIALFQLASSDSQFATDTLPLGRSALVRVYEISEFLASENETRSRNARKTYKTFHS
jgi:hypothetical protein